LRVGSVRRHLSAGQRTALLANLAELQDLKPASGWPCRLQSAPDRLLARSIGSPVPLGFEPRSGVVERKPDPTDQAQFAKRSPSGQTLRKLTPTAPSLLFPADYSAGSRSINSGRSSDASSPSPGAIPS